MRNPGQDVAQAGIKIPGRSINKFRYADDTALMAESKEEIDISLELSCFFYDPTDVGNLISGSFVFPKSILSI